MNKQRLMELAGITEAGQAGGSSKYVVVTLNDGYFGVMGPFSSEKEAERYVKWEIGEYQIEDEENYGQVVNVSDPNW